MYIIELEAMVANSLAESGEVRVVMKERREEKEQSWPSPDPADIVFRSSTSRYFCGEGRSNSPFGTVAAFFNYCFTILNHIHYVHVYSNILPWAPIIPTNYTNF